MPALAVITVAWQSDGNHTAGITSARGSGCGWFVNYALAAAAVHHHAEWLCESQMPYATFFGEGRLLIQPLPIERTFSRVWVHGEVADLKCGQVLKEMAALRRGHAKIAESGFHDHASSGDFVPFHGNAEPGIVRPPAPDANQQIRTILRAQHGVEVGHSLGHFLAAAALEVLGIDHDHVTQVVDAAVTQNFCALADELR